MPNSILRCHEVSLFVAVKFPDVKRHFQEVDDVLAARKHWSCQQRLQVGVEALLPHCNEGCIQAAKRLLRRQLLHAHHDVRVALVEDVVKIVELRVPLLQKPPPLFVRNLCMQTRFMRSLPQQRAGF